VSEIKILFKTNKLYNLPLWGAASPSLHHRGAGLRDTVIMHLKLYQRVRLPLTRQCLKQGQGSNMGNR